MLSILIPVYNEEKAIVETVHSIQAILEKSFIANAYEILVINDGSTDGTGEKLQQIHHPNCTIINHSINKGYGSALKTGMRKAKYDTLFITDADATYPNHEIPAMLESYQKKQLDMLVGARITDHGRFLLIRNATKGFLRSFASYITEYKIPDLNSGMRVFNKAVALKFLSIYPNGFSFTTTITMALITNSYQVEYYPIEYFKREGKSKIKPIRDTFNFLLLIVRMSMYFNPLRVFIPATLFLMMLALAAIGLDIFWFQNLSDKSILFGTMTGLFFSLGLIADAVAKKSFF